jgi:hypothetical protein
LRVVQVCTDTERLTNDRGIAGETVRGVASEPGDREELGLQLEALNEVEVGGEAVTVVVGDITRVAVNHLVGRV